MGKILNSNYKYYVLLLCAINGMFTVAMPTMSMTVLFDEISKDLGLSTVQIGIVWGIFPLGVIVFALFGGMLGDRFGTKPVIGIACLLTGLAGASRGLSDSFISLTATMFLFGAASSILPIINPKVVGTWFHGRQLALGSSILSISLAAGFTLGTFLSATTFSPLFGGWRNVLFVYGVIAFVLGILWLLTYHNPDTAETSGNTPIQIPFRQSISHVVRNKSVWLLAIVLLGHIACVQGTLGYLPYYLRNSGWTPVNADSAAASFHIASMIATIPIALLSNRFGSRKLIFYLTMIMTGSGVALLSMADGPVVWTAVIIAGFCRDGFMAIFITTLMETEGIDAKYIGTALGLIFTLARIGNIISPMIGNSLESINPSLPFLFWSLFAVIALVASFFLKETARKYRQL